MVTFKNVFAPGAGKRARVAGLNDPREEGRLGLKMRL
jgi:hypothetical protein